MAPLWIALAFVFGLGVRQLGLPSLVGYLAAGFTLAAMGHEAGHALEHVAELGVLLLLFTVGLKLRLRSLVRPEVLGGGALHLVVWSLPVTVGLHWIAGLSWQAAMFLGVALGFSSTVVAAKGLEDRRELRAFHGRVAIGVLILQDLVAVALLAVASGEMPSYLILALLGLPLLAPLLGRLLAVIGHDELLVLYGLLLAIVVGGLGFEEVGLSPELGALVLGALLANHSAAKELSHALWGLKEIFLVGFFLQIGMSGLPTVEALVVAGILVLLLPLKAGLFFHLLVRFRLRSRTAFLVAITLATYSEFCLIVARVAAEHGFVPGDWVVALAITVSLSFALAAPFARHAHPFFHRASSWLLRFERGERHPDEQPLTCGAANALILGMGRVGTGAYDFLTERGARPVGLDSDPGKVEKHLKEGRRVLYGDAEDPGLWHQLDLEGVEVVLLAMPDLEAKLLAARELRSRGFPGLVSATSAYSEEARQIVEAGATTTFNYFDQAGPGFADHTWRTLHPADEWLRDR